METLETFRARTQGADEVLERTWSPNQVVETHVHPFDADALVTAGEMWLTCADQTRHLRPGDTFAIRRGTPHSEKYGAEGATYLVARTTR